MTDIPTPLVFVDPAAVDSRYRVLLYGQPGVGKSVAAVSAPGPVLVLSADRPGAYRFARTLHPAGHIREVCVTGKRTLLDAYEYVKATPEIQTVVVDPLGNVYDRLLTEIGGSKPQIQHHGDVQKTILGLIQRFRDLDVHLVLVCHEELDEEGAVRQPMTGGKKLPAKVQGEMDIVAHCGRIVAKDDAQDRYVGVLIDEGTRVGKDSTGALGRVRDLNLAEWFETATQALTPADNLPWDGDPGEDEIPPEDDPEAAGGQFDLEDARAEAAA